MCHHCATNPSIHHHSYCITAVSLPLSHYGVTFTVTLSWLCYCRHGVAFASVMVLSLPSQCHLRCCIVVVSLLQSHHCSAFAVALSWFCRRRHGVTLLQFCHRHRGVAFMSVTVSLLPLQCCLAFEI